MPVYQNSPIQEASCEFHFDPSSLWDMAVPGLFFEQVREGFPKRKPMRTVESSPGQTTNDHQIKLVDRLQCWSEDEKSLLQISSNFFCVNQLNPYQGWDSFKGMILSGLNAYVTCAGVPIVQSMVMRYVDLITIPVENALPIGEWFHFHSNMLTLPNSWSETLAAFLVGHQYLRFEGRDLLSVHLSTSQPVNGKPTFLLDTQYALVQPDAIKVGRTEQWLDDAHSAVIEMFEACITDQLRETFHPNDHARI